ncbi:MULTISPECIES: excisionase [unclassified Sphingomonas]|uniref:excisionase n=1 Tax=unclassified Sphingomonas TaxID=196159 RepID=UPI00285BF2D7|nr:MULTISPECIES: excisionase [unclassified Sphingomonas]MDR6116513.1 hypothetical protein [Sphingomonas sp. SORGH_AS_0789]MDR6149812.1 hypothetical protein [Sphingomonas sp. SORGH_AS_0742]
MAGLNPDTASGLPRFIRVRRFAEVSGYSERAIYLKIQRGVWLDGHQYRRAPDGSICIDLEGYYRWVEGKEGPASSR